MSGTRPSFGSGITLEIATLANYGNEIFAIDLASKALLRFEADHEHLSHLAFNPFALWKIRIEGNDIPLDPSRPELVEVSEATALGQLNKKRQVSQLCKASLAPEELPLLGFNGPSISFSRVNGMSPSMTLVELSKRQSVRKNTYGEITISFPWGGIIPSLPLGNEAEREIFARADRPLNSDTEVGSVLGFHPGYAVIALAKPKAGYCKKVAVGLLPKGISRKTARILREKQLGSQPVQHDFQPETPVIIDGHVIDDEA